ncbi:MAG: branched-chain amino acid ABC transporter permease [Streptosporangiales bacterium]|nr:branched-chain amino acid ABC transporter permease [Streptosporangiales bacterium]
MTAARLLRLGAVALVVVAAVAVPPFVGTGNQIALINIAYVMFLCVAWNIIAGYAGQFALGQPVFLAIGAYTSTKLYLAEVSPWFGMAAGAAISGIAAAGLGLLAFRYKVRGLYFALLTFASLLVAENIVRETDWLGGTVGLLIPLGDSAVDMNWRTQLPYYYVILVLLLLGTLVSWWVRRSTLGWRLAAVQQDEEAAPAVGIDVNRAKLTAFVISAVLTSCGGTFYAQYYQLVSPETVLSFDPQIQMLIGAIIGGLGTFGGPLVGGLLVGGFNQVLLFLPLSSQFATSAGQIAFAIFLLVMAIRAPKGVVGIYTSLRARVVRSSARHVGAKPDEEL